MYYLGWRWLSSLVPSTHLGGSQQLQGIQCPHLASVDTHTLLPFTNPNTHKNKTKYFLS